MTQASATPKTRDRATVELVHVETGRVVEVDVPAECHILEFLYRTWSAAAAVTSDPQEAQLLRRDAAGLELALGYQPDAERGRKALEASRRGAHKAKRGDEKKRDKARKLYRERLPGWTGKKQALDWEVARKCGRQERWARKIRREVEQGHASAPSPVSVRGDLPLAPPGWAVRTDPRRKVEVVATQAPGGALERVEVFALGPEEERLARDVLAAFRTDETRVASPALVERLRTLTVWRESPYGLRYRDRPYGDLTGQGLGRRLARIGVRPRKLSWGRVYLRRDLEDAAPPGA